MLSLCDWQLISTDFVNNVRYNLMKAHNANITNMAKLLKCIIEQDPAVILPQAICIMREQHADLCRELCIILIEFYHIIDDEFTDRHYELATAFFDILN
jgi:hypothetical protein